MSTPPTPDPFPVHSDRVEPPIPEPEPATGSQPHRWGPSTVTIVWGVLLLAIAALGAGYGLLGLTVDPILLGALVVAGCGLFLVLVAAFGARRRPTTEQRTSFTTD